MLSSMFLFNINIYVLPCVGRELGFTVGTEKIIITITFFLHDYNYYHNSVLQKVRKNKNKKKKK